MDSSATIPSPTPAPPTPPPALTAEEIAKMETELGIALSAQERSDLANIVKPAPSAWRTAAESRIETHRKADMTVRVTDANGAPLPGATVDIRLQSHDFKFGGVLRLRDWLDLDLNLQGISTDRYRDIFLRLFNSAGCENAFKTRQLNWGWNEVYLPDFMVWAERNGLPVRGHALIWPGVDDANNHLPDDRAGVYDMTTPVQDLENDPNNVALVLALRERIEFVLSYWAANFTVYEWDVVNEPRTNYRVQAVLGGPIEMATWFNIAATHVPNVDCKLILNEFGVISAFPPEVNAQQYIEYRDAMVSNIDAVLSGGGKLDRLGFQSRMKRGHLDPALVYERLSEFSVAYPLLDMVGTEFEVLAGTGFSPDEYERGEITEETMTVYFSHPQVTGLNQWTYMRDLDQAMCYYDGTIKLNGLVWYYVHRMRYNTERIAVTDEKGEAVVRGFKGIYDISVTTAGGTFKTFRPTTPTSEHPSQQPTTQPSLRPTTPMSEQPSQQPTTQPSFNPTKQPAPTPVPQTNTPSLWPSSAPSLSFGPTNEPSTTPTVNPSPSPSMRPSSGPSKSASPSPPTPVTDCAQYTQGGVCKADSCCNWDKGKCFEVPC